MAESVEKPDSLSSQALSPAKVRLTGPERSLKAATLFVSSVQDFRLCAAVYGNPVRRDYWTERLRKNLAETHTLLTVLDFAPLSETRLLDALRDHLKNEPTPAGWRRAVCVFGLESRLPDPTAPTGHSRTTNRFLAEANLDRELFPRVTPVPILLWLTPTGIGSFSREAPDLWHWRSHVFDFEESEASEDKNKPRGVLQLEAATSGTLYHNREEMERAAAIFTEGLRASLQAHGPSHPATCRARGNLGNVFKQLGSYREAEKLFRENLAEIEKQPDGQGDEIGPALTGLGLCLLELGDFVEAELCLRRALTISEKNFDSNHATIAIRLNNLATLLKATNRLAEAESMMRLALEIDEKKFGKDHPNVALRLNNLAAVLQHTNRLAEAEPMIRRALKIDEKNLGKDHPNVAIRLNNLALLLKDTNRLAEAEPMMRRALEIDEKNRGTNHPVVAIRLNNLARLLRDTKRIEQSKDLQRLALEILLLSTYRTGHEHPQLQICTNNYISLLEELGWEYRKIDEHIAELKEAVKRPGFKLSDAGY